MNFAIRTIETKDAAEFWALRFEMLELEPFAYGADLEDHAEGSISDQVRRAFHQFATKYHPDQFQKNGAEERKVERAAQIYRRGAEAYRILCDPKRRKAYDVGLTLGKVRFDASAEPVPEAAVLGKWPIKVKNPIARPFATKGVT